MTDEVKTKRPVPPQFQKKKKELAQPAETPVESQEDAVVSEPIVVHSETQPVAAQLDEPKKEIDVQGLIRDLSTNRYFRIFEKEAKPIAERMVKEGAHTLLEVKWFLAHSEREQLAKELKEKYNLL